MEAAYLSDPLYPLERSPARLIRRISSTHDRHAKHEHQSVNTPRWVIGVPRDRRNSSSMGSRIVCQHSGGSTWKMPFSTWSVVFESFLRTNVLCRISFSLERCERHLGRLVERKRFPLWESHGQHSSSRRWYRFVHRLLHQATRIESHWLSYHRSFARRSHCWFCRRTTEGSRENHRYTSVKTSSRSTNHSGLDPAGPYFENTDPVVRLDPTDALFVDVIHTDGAHNLLLGLGKRSSVGLCAWNALII